MAGETPGAVLRRAREAKGISVKELAAITRISPRLVEALEASRYDEFPAEVFVRGFLRSCARELDVDSDELLALYYQQTGSAPPSAASSVPTRAADRRGVEPLFNPGRLPRFSYLIAIVAILLGLGLSILMFGGSETQELSDGDVTPATGTWNIDSP